MKKKRDGWDLFQLISQALIAPILMILGFWISFMQSEQGREDAEVDRIAILDHIDFGHVALPVFQRGYVWNRGQMRGLMQSLGQSNPVGNLREVA